MDNNFLSSLYFNDLQGFPDLPMSRKLELEHLARQGDEQAKRELIESALRYVAHVAAFYASAYGPFLRHDSYLDLVQEGNLALVEAFERALKAKSISGYLRGTAKIVIRRYCLYRSGLFRVPTHPEWIARAHSIESLDAMIGDTELKYSDVMAILSDIEEDEQSTSHTYQALYDPLRQLLASSLTEKQREVVVRYYGFDGQEPETLYAISKRLGIASNAAWKRLQLVLKKLHRALEESR